MKRLSSLYGAALLAVAAWAPLPSHAAVEVLNEGFNSVSGLSGWSQFNASVPPGNAWFQGNSGIFSAQSGPANSYAGANYLSASGGMGVVDNWLITPTLNLTGLTSLSFYTSNAGTTGFDDLLEVRFASGSTGAGVDAFSTLLLTIGGDTAFPAQWQQFTANLAVEGEGQFAFRYLGDAAALDYVGLDTVRVITAVPEPSTYLMLLAGLGAVGAAGRRLRKAGINGRGN